MMPIFLTKMSRSIFVSFILLFVNVLCAEHCKLSLTKTDEYARSYQKLPVEIILHCGVHNPKRCQMGNVRINWSLNGDLIRNKNAQFEMRIVVDRQSPTKTRYQCVVQNAVEAVSRVFTIRSNGRLVRSTDLYIYLPLLMEHQ
ncbi:hypothetical protein P879_10905 [Paragonimus westermani]|uniref:CD47 immunoglobulin-like domain-containing protein n=1 Tax=Paragonimus westermani TaxID=34504 RepID=A0A8T0D5D2_9TREM|nr:hypothetical protein P879_10905 [Paragonimus westermani]